MSCFYCNADSGRRAVHLVGLVARQNDGQHVTIPMDICTTCVEQEATERAAVRPPLELRDLEALARRAARDLAFALVATAQHAADELRREGGN